MTPKDVCNTWEKVGENTCGTTYWCAVCGAIKYDDWSDNTRTIKEYYEIPASYEGCPELEGVI